MPFANNQGIRIHYEVEGQGPPLVLQHGLSGDLGSWRLLGYVDALKEDYQLILIDARGHGASDKPHDPQAYRKALMASDVTAVLDEVGVGRTHFFGYSMGGTIGFAVARFAPERLASLIVGGSHPYELDPSEPNPGAEARISLLRQGVEAWMASIDAKYRRFFSPGDMDPEALIACQSFRERVGLADAVQALTLPCLLFAGENDPVHANARRCAEAMPKATFVSVPNANHLDAVQLDLTLSHVKEFLARVSQAPAVGGG